MQAAQQLSSPLRAGRMSLQVLAELPFPELAIDTFGFTVDDGSEKIQVDPAGAEFHLDTTMSRFEPGEGARTIGSYVLNAFSQVLEVGAQSAIASKRSASPSEGKATFLERLASQRHTLRSQEPERGKRFIVSLKSEEELVSSARHGAMWLTLISCIAIAGAIAAFVLSAIKR